MYPPMMPPRDELLHNICEFHNHFGFDQRKHGEPIDKKLLAFRLKFMLEELEEFAQASKKQDLVAMTDGLVDLVYVALGTAWLYNLPFPSCWGKVHAANMTKVRAEREDQSSRGGTFDVIKPKGWIHPDLKSLFREEDVALKIEDVKTNEQQLSLLDYIDSLEKDD